MNDYRVFHATSSLAAGGPRIPAKTRGLRWRPATAPPRTAPRVRGASIRSFGTGIAPHELLEAIGANYHRSPRPVPSAGATYGLSFYLLTSHAADEPAGQAVLACTPSMLRRLVFNRLEGQFSLIVIAAALSAYTRAYGARGYRYALIESGHFAQMFLLDAYRHGWSACPIGSFHDDGVAQAISAGPLGIDTPLYLIGVGRA
jgi:nitroreductase